MIRVLLVEDHTIVRKGLKLLIDDTKDIRVTSEATDGIEAVRTCNSSTFDVLVLDITLPTMNGLEVIKRLKSQKNKTPILVLSMHSEDIYAIRAIRAGASGYLTKDRAPEELIDAIRRVARNQKYITTEVADMLVLEVSSPEHEVPHKSLSDREYEIMIKIALGKSLSLIAQELFLSIKTISTYRSRILLKMGMHSNAEIIKYSLKNNLLQ
ncbi:response regulator transcription factor [bacterium]|nr:response regulator transcription factor [candidate division CSSED10-310 bacterium]